MSKVQCNKRRECPIAGQCHHARIHEQAHSCYPRPNQDNQCGGIQHVGKPGEDTWAEWHVSGNLCL